MKRCLFLFLSFLIVLTAHTQDIIVQRDGSTILSKVLEVNQDNIKYKKFSNPNGPTYSISKSDILAINYENGEKDSFEVKEAENIQSSQDDAVPILIEKSPDINNAEIIRQYDSYCSPKKELKQGKDNARVAYSIWRISPSSVMSNEDLEIKFIRRVIPIHHFEAIQLADHRYCVFYPLFVYHINFHNKTDHIIYLDKGNCFKILGDGSSYCYFNLSEQTTVSHGNSSGISLGVGGVVGSLIGGIGVGVGSSTSLATTYSQQRVIAIPPQGNINLTEYKVMDKYPYKILEHAEYFTTKTWGNAPKLGFIKKGQVLNYGEDTSPWKRQYIFTYSNDGSFKTYSTMKVQLYLSQMIGQKVYLNFMQLNHNAYEKYIEGVNEKTIIDWSPLDR